MFASAKDIYDSFSGKDFIIFPPLSNGGEFRFIFRSDMRYYICFNLKSNKGRLIYAEYQTRSGNYIEYRVDLKDNLGGLPLEIRDFIIFNVDLFS